MSDPRNTLQGLNKNDLGYWVLDKRINGKRLYKSTRKKDYKDAERIALKWIHDAEQAEFYGHAEQITFVEAATMFLQKEKKKSIACDANDLKKLIPFIGNELLESIHNQSFDEYKKHQLTHGGKDGTGAKGTTINRSLRTASRVLKLAAVEWRDSNGKPYLKTAPLIRMMKESDKETTRPLEYFEERRLIDALNDKWKDLWRFAAHTGLRDQTQAQLRWEWERSHPKIDNVMFVVPGEYLKYGDNIGVGDDNEWLLVLNSAASEIVNRWRDRSGVFVFPNPDGIAHARLGGSHFKDTREALGMKHISWHSARATFGTRLRSTGVTEEDRSYLLAHNTGSITTQYSWANIKQLIECVEKLCDHEEETEESLFSLASLRKPSDRIKK